MIDLSVRRPVATAALYVALLALGAYSFGLIPVELLPDVDYPRLTVSATWQGASPEQLEARVTAPLEGAAQRVQGVRRVTSTSRMAEHANAALARVEVEFARDARMEFARLELNERIAALREELPEGVRPRVEPYVPEEFAEEQREFLSWRLRGPFAFGHLARIAEETLKPRALAVDGVSAVRVAGGEEREVLVEADRERLRELGLTAGDLSRILYDLSAPRPAGSVGLGGRETALAVRTRAADVEELRGLVVSSRGRSPIRLSDVADVREGTAERTSYHRVNGQPAVSLAVHRQAGTNALALADRVKAAVDSARSELPAGVHAELDHDGSEEIRQELTDLRLRAAASALVILLVLALFLRSLGAVLALFATIGFSVLIAVNLLFLGGFSLNVLTLAGLAWGFGLVVDNGIVVMENVDRRRGEGLSRREAAVEGARQVLLPVVAATATTAIVLVPFLFLQGELRIYYVPLGWAVGFSILASLFVAFTFVPAMSARLAGPGAGEGEGGGDPSGGRSGPVPGSPGTADRRPGRAPPPLYVRGYRAVLEWALDHPVIVVLVCLGALFGSWRLFDAHVTRGVRWASYWGQQTYISIRITYPRGAGLERTDRLARSFEQRLATIPQVDRYETVVRPRWAHIRVTFPEELERTAVPVAIKERMVAYSYGFSGPEVRVYGFGPSFYGGGASRPNYSVALFGYNYLELERIAGDLAARLERFARIRDVDPNASGLWYERDRAFEFVLAVDREALGAHDLTVEQLLAQVSRHVQGTVARRSLRVGGEEVRYAVKLSGWRDFSFRDLRELRVPTDGGGLVRVADVARVEQRETLSRILREDQQYRRSVAWEFRGPRKLGDLVRDAALEATELPPGYRIESDRFGFRWTEEERTQVWLAVGFAVLLVYMVTAALFGSLAAPFVVLLTLPLALIGVFLVFFYADATFTRTAYIGAIMMGGIVVNNAILVVYHIGELRERLPDREAIVRGTLERVRPILMTTLTTVLGLLPLVLFAQSQDENIWNALALATIGGLLSSTVFVLVTIPVAYRWIVARGEGR